MPLFGADYCPSPENDCCAGEGVDPAVMQQVGKMVGQSCSTCSKAMRAEGIKVMLHRRQWASLHPAAVHVLATTCSMFLALVALVAGMATLQFTIAVKDSYDRLHMWAAKQTH